MAADNQHETVAFLSDPGTHGIADKVDIIETHISRIFLAGDRAWKMKREVKLPYVDFSTPELRLESCRREVELNSLTASDLYLAAHPITQGADGALQFDGEGILVDGVVEMRRFEQDCLLDRTALAGGLTPEMMDETARKIEHFHRIAPIDRTKSGSARMADVLDINEAGFAQSRVFDQGELQRFHGAMRAALAKHAELLNRRSQAGRVRRCHGDLHLRNICLLDGEPHLFDCIEFNDEIATVDVLYDLAFLLMDLWRRGFADLANLVMNRYFDQMDDEGGFPLLPFFMAVRAAVRAHVLATQAAGEGAQAGETIKEARSYFRLANSLLSRHRPRLVAIGGFSGSGKTTIAERLAPHLGAPPGARIIESDRIRKAMHGVSAETRLPQEAYLPEVSLKVYCEMAVRADLILAGGGTVVANAVFERLEDRAMIEDVATGNDISFRGVWLTAEADVLSRRVAARKGGSSDATVEILAQQLDRMAGAVEWDPVDVEGPPDAIVASVLEALERGGR
ncbi:bifunctional aminoglycoside phosphotransferase/ATP-binding protein [Chelativorans sp. Marseille-P2723]|uniref:bifunctional aminoglycoside phosphotransferase/ATP-binding protein n=1 Tax=Chelativorans sp. Marseille-P2723 TaxID=2709133 RepID=UPI00156DBF98|nr:bifunctional aminoglycoside phosphotransferase/ATP-binding protein [Chelativorans sp. Marseille-P2723]